MKQHKVIKSSLMLYVFVLLGFAGCRSRYDYDGSMALREQQPQMQPKTVPERFQEGPSSNRSVVQSAMEMSEKYAQLSDRATALQQENQQMSEENAQLKRKVIDLQDQLKKAQGELTEANELLIEMLGELNQWKSDILGFRNEMRQASQAQLEALLKILNILGAEIDLETPEEEVNEDSNQTSSEEAQVPANGT